MENVMKAKRVVLKSHFCNVEQYDFINKSKFLDKKSCNMSDLSSTSDIKTTSTKQGELIYPSPIAGLS